MHNKPPLIAHIIYSFGVGGLENGLVNLINHMPPEKYQHVIICLKQSTDFSQRLKRQDVRIYELNKLEGQDWPSFYRLFKLLKQLKPDIVHTRNLATIEYQVPALLAGIKHRIHGEHGWDVFDPDGEEKKYQWIRRLLGCIIQYFIPLSRQLQNYLVDKVNIPEHKIHRICNGVDTTKFYPVKNHKDKLDGCPFSFTKDEIYIATIGRMHGVKDQITLINAFIILLAQTPELEKSVRLMVIGEGPLRKEAVDLLKKSGLSHLAWLPGARDDVAEIMRCIDIFVLPSQAEGISNTILEAMATGLPVIATHVGGNPELVEQGITGSLIEKQDASSMAKCLLEYVQDIVRRQQSGKNARMRIVEQFSLQIMVDQYTRVYDLLTERKA